MRIDKTVVQRLLGLFAAAALGVGMAVGGGTAAAVDPVPRGMLAYDTEEDEVTAVGTAYSNMGLFATVTLAEERCLRVVVAARLAASTGPVSADVVAHDATTGEYLSGQTHHLAVPGGSGSHSYHVEAYVDRDPGTYTFQGRFRRVTGGIATTVTSTGMTADLPRYLVVEDVGSDCHFLGPEWS